MARGDCNITNICIPTRRIIYSAGFTPTPPPPPTCQFPDGSFSQGGEICDWGYRVRWDIDPSQVPSDQTNYLAYISLDELVSDLTPINNTLFWNDANRDEFRVTTSDGATEIPHYTSRLSTVSESGYIWALVPSVSSSVTTSLFIYLANPAATEYAVGDPLGRNATFTGAGFTAFWDFEQDPTGVAPQLTDLTGNGWNGTVSDESISTGPSGTVTHVSGKVGRAYLFGNRRFIDCGVILAGTIYPTMHMGLWVKGTNTGRGLIGGYRAGSTAQRYDMRMGGVAVFDSPTSPSTLVGSATINDDVYHRIEATYRPNISSGDRIYVDGGIDAQRDASLRGRTVNNNFLIAHLNNSAGVPVTANADLEGEISLAFWIDMGYLDEDRVSTEHANQNAPGTFATFTNFLANT